MKLIILYGPPASGKLTVAKELAKTADVKVFDNHQVIDFVEPIISRAYDKFVDLVYAIQLKLLTAAMEMPDLSVVFTLGYAANAPGDPEFLQKIIDTAKGKGAEVYPVFLRCNSEELLKRVSSESRSEHGKITKPETLKSMIDRYDFSTPLPGYELMVVDSDQTSAELVASQVRQLAGM